MSQNTTKNADDIGSKVSGISSTDIFYEVHAAEYFERTVNADLTALHEKFLSVVPGAGKILDAGCGSGRDLRVFADRGFCAMGIDASHALVRLANTYSKVPCVATRLEDLTFDNCFDGIWACASLLHLPRSMLQDVLRRLHKSLTPNGIIFTSVQHGDGERTTPDGRFFSLYTPIEFENALGESGFLIRESWKSEDKLIGRETIRWINVLATKSNK